MRKPYMTESKPESMPNAPKMYPGDQGMKQAPGGTNMDGFAEKAKIKGADQLNTVAVPIDPIHVFGSQAKDSRPLHVDTKMPSSPKMSDFANKLHGPIPGSRMKTPKV